jgi:Flp pilus assembly protein TadG
MMKFRGKKSVARPNSRERIRRNWISNKDGAVAVEFALIATPFFLLVMAVIEFGMVLWAGAALDDATQSVARKIRTGQFQSATNSITPETAAALFREEICSRMEVLMPCARSSADGTSVEDPFYFDVRTFESFTDVDVSELAVDEVTGLTITKFDPGGESQVVLVRTYYEWDTIIPGSNVLYSHGSTSNGVLLSSTTAFRSEAFPTPE